MASGELGCDADSKGPVPDLARPRYRSGGVIPAPAADERSPVRGALFVYAHRRDPGSVHALRQGRNSIGTGKDCDVTVEDPVVSRLHGFFMVGPDGCRYVDAGSSNGTLVNGESSALIRWTSKTMPCWSSEEPVSSSHSEGWIPSWTVDEFATRSNRQPAKDFTNRGKSHLTQ